MKSFSEIKDNFRIKVAAEGEKGFNADITMPHWTGSLVCSVGAGWEHVSVAPYRNILPSWEDMCIIKDIFWNDDEAVIQIHPPKAEYVNNKRNCLHLWRCTYKEMVLPPSVLVGVREGQSLREIDEEITAAFELAGETR